MAEIQGGFDVPLEVDATDGLFLYDGPSSDGNLWDGDPTEREPELEVQSIERIDLGVVGDAVVVGIAGDVGIIPADIYVY